MGQHCRHGRTSCSVAALLLVWSCFSAQPASAQLAGCDTCPLDWTRIVCATYDDMVLELPNECVARCQGITRWTQGHCKQPKSNAATARGAPASPKAFTGLSDSLRVTNQPVSWSVMTSKAADGYVYVGTYKSLKGPSIALKARNKKAVNEAITTEDDSCNYGVSVELPHGHTYVQTRAKRSTAAESASWLGHAPNAGQFNSSTDKNTAVKGRLLQILGRDDRFEVSYLSTKYPYTTAINIVFSKANGKRYICSGALIAKNVVLTAAHCVYDYDRKGWTTDFVLKTPDYYGLALPVSVTYLTTYKGYLQTKAIYFDVAVMRLSSDLGTRRGWMGVQWDCSVAKQWMRTIGYPGDKQEGSTPRMYQTECYSRGDSKPCDNKQLYHSCDTHGGQSGSPMFYFKADKLAYVKAVLTCEYTNPSIPWNCGAWLRPQIWPVIKEFLAKS